MVGSFSVGGNKLGVCFCLLKKSENDGEIKNVLL